MSNAESRFVYEGMKRRAEIVEEIEMLRPSDNPFVTVAGIFLTTVAFVGITIDNAPRRH